MSGAGAAGSVTRAARARAAAPGSTPARAAGRGWGRRRRSGDGVDRTLAPVARIPRAWRLRRRTRSVRPPVRRRPSSVDARGSGGEQRRGRHADCGLGAQRSADATGSGAGRGDRAAKRGAACRRPLPRRRRPCRPRRSCPRRRRPCRRRRRCPAVPAVAAPPAVEPLPPSLVAAISFRNSTKSPNGASAASALVLERSCPR